MGILEEMKTIAVTVREAGNIPLYGQVLELQRQVLELVQENGELKSELRTLKRKDETRQQLVRKNGSYYHSSEAGEEGPVCPRCYLENEIVVRLKKDTFNHPFCPHCHKAF